MEGQRGGVKPRHALVHVVDAEAAPDEGDVEQGLHGLLELGALDVTRRDLLEESLDERRVRVDLEDSGLRPHVLCDGVLRVGRALGGHELNWRGEGT